MLSGKDRPQGAALARVFAARGVRLAPDEAAELARLLLDLADAGALTATSPAAVHQAAGRPSHPKSSGRRPVVRREGGSPLYHMGPSIHGTAGEDV